MTETIILNILTQFFYFFGVVFLIGFLISRINRRFYGLWRNSHAVCLATGFLGTPIHELGHAFFCVVFRHKIEEIKLFQIDDESGTLGYVSHSYNRRNIWQKLGNYFIGVAPILCGSAVLLLFANWLIPYAYNEMYATIRTFARARETVFSSGWFASYWDVFCGMLFSMFTDGDWGWGKWVFFVLSFCIALHMNLSGADIKNALPSIPLLCVVLIAVNFAIGLISASAYRSFLNAMNFAGGFVSATLLLSIALSVAYLIVGLLMRLVFRILHLR